MKLEIRAAEWAEDQALLREIRQVVFVREQNVPSALEWDGKDATSEHALAFADGRCVGTGRLEPAGKIGRMAVLESVRGQGVGAAILRHLLARAAACGLARVHLHAQAHALPFYERLGFVASGAVFDEAGIPHRYMECEVS